MNFSYESLLPLEWLHNTTRIETSSYQSMPSTMVATGKPLDRFEKLIPVSGLAIEV